jgi:Na+/phosphate symporter
MTLVLFPILICAIGLVMYPLMSNPKAQELGRIMFFCGLLVVLLNAPQTGSIVIR